MFSLHRRFDDEIIIDDVKYEIDASFDNILLALDIYLDEEADDFIKVGALLTVLINDRLSGLDFNRRANCVVEILEKYMEFESSVVYDLNGDPMMKPPSEERDELMSLVYDADIIFASFYKAYGIDLIAEQGRMHWLKFKALLDYLPSDTPMKEIMHIRGWKPSDDKRKKADVMREMKKSVALPIKEEGGN